MPNNRPYDRLIGPNKIYVAPYGEAVPLVSVTPGGNWVYLGSTDGEQSFTQPGELTYLRDNEHTGPVKSVRPEEDVIYNFTLVSLTLENWTRLLNSISKLVDVVGPPNTRTAPLKRGYYQSEYSFIAKSTVLSPYGPLPGMFYIPRGVFDGEPEVTFDKENGAALEVAFTALEDDAQVNPDNSLGWLITQIA